MAEKPSYEELEQSVKKLTKEALEHNRRITEVERIFDFSPDMIGSGNLKGYFTKINATFGEILGYTEKEIHERPFILFVHDEEVEKTKEALADAVKGKKNIYIQNRYKCKDGSYKWIEWKILAIAKENKFIAVGREITARKRSEKLMEEALIEKELLLKEINHRVKNNFEIISSLLELSRMQTENQEIQRLWGTVRDRIHAMALVHDQLYQSDHFDHVQMDRHIRNLMDYLSSVYSDPESSIELMLNAPEVTLSVSQAIPCSLVLNELISNAFKHAFRGRKTGVIQVAINNPGNNSTGETVFINVKDDGIGFPEEIDINDTGGLGLKLTRYLVAGQLKGKMRVDFNNGTEIRIEFKKTK